MTPRERLVIDIADVLTKHGPEKVRIDDVTSDDEGVRVDISYRIGNTEHLLRLWSNHIEDHGTV